jgi:hypothetical protein
MQELATFRKWGRDLGLPEGPYPYMQRLYPELYRLSLDRLKELEQNGWLEKEDERACNKSQINQER